MTTSLIYLSIQLRIILLYLYSHIVSFGQVLIGEWGGFYNGRDQQFQDELVSYMIQNCITDNTYWTLNPTSSDTGGILQSDWRTPVAPKLALLARLNPNPARLSSRSGLVTLTPGRYANRRCH